MQGSTAPLGYSEVPKTVALQVDGDLSSLPPVNPCCYYPCQHLGVCMRIGLEGYKCDCTRTGYFGANCTSRKSTALCWVRTELSLPGAKCCGVFVSHS